MAWHQAASKGNDYLHFSDPVWLDPKKMSPEFVESLDIICPNANRALNAQIEQRPADAMQTFQAAAAGKTMWLYECEVPVTGLDPYNYFRLMAWRCFANGATGQGFWALGANGHRDTNAGSWDTFTMGTSPATIAFWNDRGVTATKYLEAIREGVQDYQLLTQLTEAIRAAGNMEKAAQAQKKLDEWVAQIGGVYSDQANLNIGPAPRTQADHARAELLPLLVELSGNQ